MPFSPIEERESMLTVDDLFSVSVSLTGIVMVMGEPDTGKSYLSRELFKVARLSGKKACLIDLDVGQQALAYPGTVALLKDEQKAPFEKMRFVGTINPYRRMDTLIFHAKSLVSFSSDCDLTIVDTSGLVHGIEGKLLKTKKINELKPDLIIAIQRKDELEHILKDIAQFKVLRVQPSSKIAIKNREIRIKNRTQRLLLYFSQPSNLFYLKRSSIRIVPEKMENDYLPGRIIGLNSSKETLALGILEAMDRENIFFLSPISPERLEEIDEIVIGERGFEFKLPNS